MSLHIRPATPDDAALILRFITDLAIYEKAEHEVKTDVAGIRDSLFGDGSTTQALICERDGAPIGYAVYFFNYSTWLGKHGLYLEDLYVSPEARGLGAGKALLDNSPALAVEMSRVGYAQQVIETARTEGSAGSHARIAWRPGTCASIDSERAEQPGHRRRHLPEHHRPARITNPELMDRSKLWQERRGRKHR